MIDEADVRALDAELSEPASPEAIAEVERTLDLQLPYEYAELLRITNGLLANDLVRIYSTADIVGRNHAYRVFEFRPGWLLIGDDSGGKGLLLRVSDSPSPVHLTDLGAIVLVDDQDVEADSLASWIKAGLKPRWLDEDEGD